MTTHSVHRLPELVIEADANAYEEANNGFLEERCVAQLRESEATDHHALEIVEC